MNYPKISIVTPNYNKGEYLEYTINSVLSQNYPNLEYIIIDGGSTDNSINIIKKYENELSYWVSEPDNGMYHAIKKGFDKSTGDIMAWINSDDMYHPMSFYTIAEIFNRYSQVNWLVGASTHFDKYNRTISVYPSRYFSRINLLTNDYQWIQQESSFWRRNLWNKVGGINENLKLAGDFDLWLRFSEHEKMFITNALIGGFRLLDEGQFTSNLEPYINEVNLILHNHNINIYDKKKIKKLFHRRRLINIINLLKIFNTNLIHNYLLKDYINEQSTQFIHFDRIKQKFILS